MITISEKDLVKKALYSWKTQLIEEKGFDFSDENVNIFKQISSTKFLSYQPIAFIFEHVLKHNPTNKEFLGFLEDYENSFLKEFYGSVAVNQFEHYFCQLLFNPPDFIYLEDDEEWLFGSYIQQVDYWTDNTILSIKLYSSSLKLESVKYYTQQYNQEWEEFNIIELSQSFVDGEMVFLPKK